MKPDRPSTTAIFVTMGRALAHAHGDIPGFDDPIAIQLLPDEYRAVVDRLLARAPPLSLREARLAVIASGSERVMGSRTVEIDDGLRAMAPGFQLVIVGAGLDARAYRMTELADSVVFEVDHPASQEFKRRQVAGLVPRCRELRHVPVDFSRDALSDALARAGHSPTLPTAWVFEGVITYLTPREVDGAIAAMAARSAPGSRLLATYGQRTWVRALFAWVTSRAGEPQRAAYSPLSMRRLLARYGFEVLSDTDGLERAERLGLSSPGRYRLLRFLHVVVAGYGDQSSARASSATS
jgi:methyltransferase (TIGR00027 family)